MENTEFTSCGQRCRIVTQELLDSGELASRPTLPDFVRRQYAFAEAHDGFFCVLTELPKVHPRFSPTTMLFYRVGDSAELVRVVVENAVCKRCGWRGRIASPAAPWLFDGAEDRFGAMRAAWEYPRAVCPSCGADLGRPAAWLDELASAPGSGGEQSK